MPSATTSQPAAASSSLQSARKAHAPIQILSTPSAQTYSHVHPLLVLSVFALRFRALVDDPQSTLLLLLPLIAVLQGVYVVICLPAAGRDSGSTGPSTSKGPRGKRRGDGAGSNAIGGKITAAILSLTLPLLLGTPLLTILLILFGAPLTTHLPHTALCASHVAVLTGTSLVYVHGTDSGAWHEIWGVSRALDTVWAAAVGTGVGAWLGAVPIPLDWDRPWQAYPITIITGAYIGYAIGCAAGRTPLIYGRRIQFTTSEEDEVGTQEQEKKQNDQPRPSGTITTKGAAK
ncbi:hypothetical protein VTO42DRAFT_7130 [Malbranchea cinnamomea]